MAKIILALSDAVVREIQLSEGRITIGRRRSNDIVIDDPAISGEHAAIIALHNDFLLEDLNSTNGTQVNGQPIRQHFLRNGDVVELAQYKARYLEDIESISSTEINCAGQRGRGDQSAGVARLRVLSGARAGQEINITKTITAIGEPGRQVAVLLREPRGGYLISHVEGNSAPVVNGNAVDESGYRLGERDIIELAGVQFEILLD